MDFPNEPRRCPAFRTAALRARRFANPQSKTVTVYDHRHHAAAIQLLHFKAVSKARAGNSFSFSNDYQR